jgi:hypothetical protein
VNSGNAPIVAAVAAATISASAAVVCAWFARRTLISERLAAADEVAVRFREPLLQAAFNLQSRIYNVVRLGFLERFMSETSPAEDREYAAENTLYQLGQYFCWVEILRRESQFLDPRHQARNRIVADQLEKIRDVFASSEIPELVFRIFRGEQRAIGEVMLTLPPTEGPHGPRWECSGYAAFVRERGDQENDRWFRRTRDDLVVLLKEPGRHYQRLVLIQHALLDLVDVLDPNGERASMGMRERL